MRNGVYSVYRLVVTDAFVVSTTRVTSGKGMPVRISLTAVSEGRGGIATGA
jgi:hypothetical protein